MKRRLVLKESLHFESLEPRRMLMCDGLVPASELVRAFARSPFGDVAGDTVTEAYDLGVVEESRDLNGRLSFWDTADVFEFQLTEDSAVDIALAEMFGSADLRVLDADETQLFDSGGNQDAVDQVTLDLDAGTYFIEVSSADRYFSRYALSIDVTPTNRAPTIPNGPTSNLTPDLTLPPALQPGVSNPQPDLSSEPSPLQDVSDFSGTNDWNLNSIGAPEAWNQGVTGNEITVAVIDTGVDTRHADLNDNIWFNSDEIVGDGIDNDGNGYVDDAYGWNFVENNANVFDTQGHGTHVAGTIAAEQNGTGATGVAFDATIMPIRVLGDNGSGSSFDIGAGIRYAVDNGADIINLSLGGGYSSSIHNALRYADSQDVFVAIASGNSGLSTPSYPALHSASLDNVLSVGAYNRNGGSAGFSNDAGGQAVQVDAPGVSVFSTLPGNSYGRYSGTSMAAPHVAGLAALALSANPSLSANELRDVLVSGAQTDVIASASPGIDATYSVAYAAANYVDASPVALDSGVNAFDSQSVRATGTIIATPQSSLIASSATTDRQTSVAFSDVDLRIATGTQRAAHVIESLADSYRTENGAEQVDSLMESLSRTEFTPFQSAV